jgi:membrane protein YqaA with SNARE-associated domain
MAKRRTQILSGVALLLILTSVALTALFLAEYTLRSAAMQAWIVSFGYIGIGLFATVTGLNVIVPIPAVAFTPVFTAAGLLLPGIIIALTLGTLLADFIGYVFGTVSRATIAAKYPKLIRQLEHLHTHHRHLILPVTFLYAAFAPIPNEALVIPLALLGVSWRSLVIPLLLGNLINQTIYAYSFQNVFRLFF